MPNASRPATQKAKVVVAYRMAGRKTRQLPCFLKQLFYRFSVG